VASVTRDEKAQRLHVTLDRELPKEVRLDDYVVNLDRASSTFVIRNNYFHDHAGQPCSGDWHDSYRKVGSESCDLCRLAEHQAATKSFQSIAYYSGD